MGCNTMPIRRLMNPPGWPVALTSCRQSHLVASRRGSRWLRPPVAVGNSTPPIPPASLGPGASVRLTFSSRFAASSGTGTIEAVACGGGPAWPVEWSAGTISCSSIRLTGVAYSPGHRPGSAREGHRWAVHRQARQRGAQCLAHAGPESQDRDGAEPRRDRAGGHHACRARLPDAVPQGRRYGLWSSKLHHGRDSARLLTETQDLCSRAKSLTREPVPKSRARGSAALAALRNRWTRRGWRWSRLRVLWASPSGLVVSCSWSTGCSGLPGRS